MNTRFNDIASRVLDLLMDVVCVVDQEGTFVYISSTCEKVFGYKQEEMVGTNMINYIHPDDREKTLEVAAQVMRGDEQPYFENRYIKKNGKTVYIMWSARWSENDKVRVAVARDVTEYKRYERTQNSIYKISQLAHQTNDLSELFKQSHKIIQDFIAADTFIIAIKEGNNKSESDHNKVKLAYCSSDNTPSGSIHHVAQNSALQEVISSGTTVLVNNHNKSDSSLDLKETAKEQEQGNWLGIPLMAQGNVLGAIIISAEQPESYSKKDIKLMGFVAEQITSTIERKEYEHKLHHMASHDWLTGLPNRLLFNDRLDVAIKRAKRLNEKLSLLFMDLDGFKEVNDTLGHSKGDLLLSKAATRLKSCVRESDTVARMGGDEFTVLLTEINEQSAIDIVLDKIRKAFKMPFLLDGTEVFIGISIGVATFDKDGEDSESLLRSADKAMYDDKRHNNSKKT